MNRKKKRPISYWKYGRVLKSPSDKVIQTDVINGVIKTYVITNGFIYWVEISGKGVYTFRKAIDDQKESD